jgi:hypothetical protein
VLGLERAGAAVAVVRLDIELLPEVRIIPVRDPWLPHLEADVADARTLANPVVVDDRVVAERGAPVVAWIRRVSLDRHRGQAGPQRVVRIGLVVSTQLVGSGELGFDVGTSSGQARSNKQE